MIEIKNTKNINIDNSRFLKNATKAINKKQESTINKANKIIGNVEKFEKEVSERFFSYAKL